MASTKFQFIFFVAFGLFIANFDNVLGLTCSQGNITSYKNVNCAMCLTLRCDGIIQLRDCGEGKLEKGQFCSTYAGCPKRKDHKKPKVTCIPCLTENCNNEPN
ncbi:unnamed protein product [Meloidogyne enterolobii]|uniref:Uncharacterized protein n=1 Tax=Meloidogyne enterolobii TaxID=390850 RepID=A0ACB0ZRK6_MELEN